MILSIYRDIFIIFFYNYNYVDLGNILYNISSTKINIFQSGI